MEIIEMIGDWTNEWMNQRGGGNNWDWDHTNSTFQDYYNRYGLDLYPTSGDYQIQNQHTNSKKVYQTTYGPNDYPSEATFQHTYTQEDTFSWSLEEKLSYGKDVSIGVVAPDIFTASTGRRFEISLTTTQEQKRSDKTEWSQQQTFHVPQNEKVAVEMIVEEVEANATKDVSVVATGSVAAGLNRKWNGHYFWFLPIGELASEFSTHPGVKVKNSHKVEFTTKLDMSGTAGVNSRIRIKSEDQAGKEAESPRTVNHIQHPDQLLVGAQTQKPSAD
ncbi:hypothetical protein C440_09828 [Haloferax mucosum ATCC BAA-1512]|uniref:Uncharacterized protein n=1 Tax=Haloferax mucosum ATCC BAA-1512 TaxID=662479 RepID=M0IF48_9EURY|nr:hypothetical protein [Haloferax mucosum]ELZ94468.1 hypothetical protein C440_09828 [Haloferax mucosum ATCC BAA-1512]